MALFKVWRGTSEELNSLEKRDGYAYFTTKDGKFHIDYVDDNNNLQRKTLNANLSDALVSENGELFAKDILEKIGNVNPREVTVTKIYLAPEIWSYEPATKRYEISGAAIEGISAKVPPLVVCVNNDIEGRIAYSKINSIIVQEIGWVESYGDTGKGAWESEVSFYSTNQPSTTIELYFISFGEVTTYNFSPSLDTSVDAIMIPVLETESLAQERVTYRKNINKETWTQIDESTPLYELVLSIDEHRCGPTVVPEVAAASSIGERVIYIGAPTSFGYVIKNSNEGKITLQSDIPFIGSLTVSGAAKTDVYVKEFTYNDGRRIIINPEEHGLTGALQVAFYIKDENGDYISSIGYTNSSYAAVYIDDTTNIVTIELDKAMEGKLILLGGNR